GGAGDDMLDGAAGNDTIFGGAGNDTINGGYGEDDMHGKEGNDVFINDDGEPDNMHGGDDVDIAQIDSSDLDTFVAMEGFYDQPDLPDTVGGDGGVTEPTLLALPLAANP